jgi:hypothetical protein
MKDKRILEVGDFGISEWIFKFEVFNSQLLYWRNREERLFFEYMIKYFKKFGLDSLMNIKLR